MRILIITQFFWPEKSRINDIARGLVERGYDVTVLTGQPNYPNGKFFPSYSFFNPTRQNYQGVEIIRVPLIPRGKASDFELVLNYLSFALTASLCACSLAPGKYDRIFVFQPSSITVGLPALVLKALTSAPILFWVQDLWPEDLLATATNGSMRSPIALEIARLLVRFIYASCDRILIQSQAYLPFIKRLGVEEERITYFPNSAEAFYQPVVVESDGIERDELPEGFCVIFAGALGPTQDFDTVLSAAERLKNHLDIHWIIIGDGRMRSWIVAESRRRGLEKTVKIMGPRAERLMPRYFSLGDALLVTLKKDPVYQLTIPTKIQSYLACAKPIVAAIDGESARIIAEARAGVISAPTDSAALAETVLALRRMPEADRRAMGHRGRLYFEKHFEREMLLGRLCEWIEKPRVHSSLSPT